MVVYNPFEVIRNKCMNIISNVLNKLNIDFSREELLLIEPPEEKGDLSYPMHKLMRRVEININEILDLLRREIDECKYIKSIYLEKGFLNFRINYPAYFKLIFNVIRNLKEKYGFNPSQHIENIIVEHTSANPIHPLHIGHLRNMLLGDTISRLLEMRGYKVRRHFYLNDMGLQVSIAAYGYTCVKDMSINTKPDYFIGAVYSITNVLATIKKLKREYEYYKDRDAVKAKEILSQIDDWISIAAKLKEDYPKIFDKILSKIEVDEDPWKSITKLNVDYENREEYAVKIVREMIGKCLEGFKQTLNKLNIHFDSWDWESAIAVWSGSTYRVLEKLSDTNYVERRNGALIFIADRVLKEYNLYKDLGLGKDYEMPDLVLLRSDGTTLYTTRDIAYTLWKFERADKIINVIGVDQTLAQRQLKLALWVLGYRSVIKRLVHYPYEIVTLSEGKMSSRRGKYITIDDILKNVYDYAYRITREKNPRLSEEELSDIAEKIGIGAVKYAFLKISPTKKILFDPQRSLNIEENTGPFLQYSYIRAKSILRKSGVKNPYALDVDPTVFKSKYEINLIKNIGKFPEIIGYSADKLKIEMITNYANRLAVLFNLFYDNIPVLRSRDILTRNSRIVLVNSFAITLKKIFYILNIPIPEKM